MAAAEGKKGAQSATPVVALFDQGVAVGRQIKRVALDKIADADLDFKVPFIIEAPNLVKDVTAAYASELDGFKASFDICRKDQKLARASKGLAPDLESDITVAPKVLQMLKGGVLPAEKMGDTLKKATLLSVFAIDVAYDKVSAEPALVAAVRLTMAGTRAVVVTDWLQLLGFCQRKGMQGPFPVARLAAFLRSMNAEMLAAYADECGLRATTLDVGDMLFTPFGAVVGEKVSTLSQGVRLPVWIDASKDPNLLNALNKKLQDVEQGQLTAKDDAMKSRLASELQLLTAFKQALSS